MNKRVDRTESNRRQAAHFDEDGNHVKMQVSADEDMFTSDEEGQLDDTESESENDLSHKESETKGTNVSESDQSAESEPGPSKKKRKKMKRCNERCKMAQKLIPCQTHLTHYKC